MEETKKEASDLKIRAINAEMQQFNQSPNLSDDSLNMNTETDAQSVPNSPRHRRFLLSLNKILLFYHFYLMIEYEISYE